MASQSDFAALQKSVVAAGFYTTLRPFEGGYNLVCASKRMPDGLGLTGNSFWVWIAFPDKLWYLVTWEPVYYVVPTHHDIVAVAVECLRYPGKTMWRLPNDIVAKYSLQVVDEPNWA